MKLSSERQYLVLENQKLVYYIIRKLGINQNSSEYEDIVSIGTIGLIKAAITFDTSKGITFGTYASHCINNEILMYYKKTKKYANNISLEEIIEDNGEGKNLRLEDTIENPNSNFVDDILKKEEYIKLVSIVLNNLTGKQRIAFLYLMADTSQKVCAEKMGITQSYVSRLQFKAIQKVQQVANEQAHYKEVFSMAIVGDEYRISFSAKDINKFNKIFATLLQNLTSVEKVPDFKVSCNKERIIIQIPAHPESFSFIAQIVQEIDEYEMSFSNRTMTHADNTGFQRGKATNKNKENESNTMQKKDDIISEAVNEAKKEAFSNSTVGRKSQVKQVRDYILSLDSFSIKDLKKHFTNLNVSAISNALYQAKRKGLITALGNGKYVVNKN